jgi:hypothetical protein
MRRSGVRFLEAAPYFDLASGASTTGPSRWQSACITPRWRSAPARPGQGLFDFANQLGQQTLSALVALVHQTLQLLEVAALCGQLGQPIGGVLVPVVHQTPQLIEVAALCSQLGQPIRSLLVTIIGKPTQY